MAPTVGRVVHYNTDVEPRVALVTYVHNSYVVDLVVFHAPRFGGPGIEVAKVSAHGYVGMGTAPGEWSWPVLVC